MELREFTAFFSKASSKHALYLRKDITSSLNIACFKNNPEKWFRLRGHDLTLLAHPASYIGVRETQSTSWSYIGLISRNFSCEYET